MRRTNPTRQLMRLNKNKKWFEDAADREGDCEVGAGVPPGFKRNQLGKKMNMQMSLLILILIMLIFSNGFLIIWGLNYLLTKEEPHDRLSIHSME